MSGKGLVFLLDAWLEMSGSCRRFFPPKMADTPTCRRHVADTTQAMSATLHDFGLPETVSVSCRHADYPTCRRMSARVGAPKSM
jgi:hypothetical protein